MVAMDGNVNCFLALCPVHNTAAAAYRCINGVKEKEKGDYYEYKTTAALTHLPFTLTTGHRH